MRYKAYPKQAIISRMRLSGSPVSNSSSASQGPSFWDITQWPQRWEEGAQELEKTAPGKLITAPIRLPEAVLTSTISTVKEVPQVVKSVTKIIPILAISAGILGAGYIVYKVTKGKKQSAQ
jgi:hypothetical protein